MVASKKVLLVDSQQMILGLTRSLLLQHNFQVAVASSSAEAHRQFASFKPDVLVTSVQLEAAVTGVDLANEFLSVKPTLHTVFLSELPDFRPLGLNKTQLPQQFAYLNRNLITDPKRLVAAIEAKRKPGALKNFRDDKSSTSDLSAVSRIQIEVLRMVALGFTNQEIADRRQVTQRAVEALLNRTASALNVNFEPGSNSRIKLARAYIREAGLPQ